MIKSFAHKGLERFFRTGSGAGIQAAHAPKLSRQLSILNVASEAREMDQPGWRFHPLTGNRDGTFSVWVNGNWRLTFRFDNGHAEIVDYEDYH
jgi:proteic killer suppression protein